MSEIKYGVSTVGGSIRVYENNDIMCRGLCIKPTDDCDEVVSKIAKIITAVYNNGYDNGVEKVKNECLSFITRTCNRLSLGG